MSESLPAYTLYHNKIPVALHFFHVLMLFYETNSSNKFSTWKCAFKMHLEWSRNCLSVSHWTGWERENAEVRLNSALAIECCELHLSEAEKPGIWVFPSFESESTHGFCLLHSVAQNHKIQFKKKY